MVERKLGDKVLRLMRGDITLLDVDAFVFDVSPDMKLGSGFGSAIQRRGGIVIQKEMDAIGTLSVGQAAATEAGILKAQHIIHVNGPKFREEDEEGKLREATLNALRCADGVGARTLAFPPIGTGLYQVPLDLCARVMVETIHDYLGNETGLKEVQIVAVDDREYKPFAGFFQEGA